MFCLSESRRDSPSWRYDTACAELKASSQDEPVYAPVNDLGVFQLKRILRLLRHSAVPLPHLKAKLGPVAMLIDWYEEDRPGGMRDFIEAAVLARAAPGFFQEQISPILSYHLIQLYCGWFFDVRDKLNMPLWIERQVFSPQEQRCRRSDSNTDQKKMYHYVWKVIAYHGGVERFMAAAVTGTIYDQDKMSWLADFSASSHVRTILRSLNDIGKLRLPDRVAAMQSATTAWADLAARGAAAKQRLEETKGPSELHTAQLAARLQIASSDDKVSDRESINVPKYTEEDLPKQ